MDLGKRMKDYYESRFQYYLPRRTYTIIRVDGKAFHTYTRGLNKPFDGELMKDLDDSAKYGCENIQGVRFAYLQSDEISFFLTDFENTNTDAWFDGNMQKIASVSASLITAKFNQLRCKPAVFDSRVFIIPSFIEVENYFLWRQQDAIRNSISMIARSLYSHKELHGMNTNQMQEMCWQKGINWNDYDPGIKRGRIITQRPYMRNGAQRKEWVVNAAPEFSSCNILDL